VASYCYVCGVFLIGIFSSRAKEELHLQMGINKIINKLSRSGITQVVGWSTKEL
jgi:hypothetical protein